MHKFYSNIHWLRLRKRQETELCTSLNTWSIKRERRRSKKKNNFLNLESNLHQKVCQILKKKNWTVKKAKNWKCHVFLCGRHCYKMHFVPLVFNLIVTDIVTKCISYSWSSIHFDTELICEVFCLLYFHVCEKHVIK